MRAAGGAFGVRETHGILWRPDNRVRAASEGSEWTSLYASAQRETPYAASYGAVRDHLVILHLDGPAGVSRVLGRHRERRAMSARRDGTRRLPARGPFLKAMSVEA